jgi:16S rRNA processing protein RimM
MTPYKIQEIQQLNKNKLVLTLLNVNKDKAEELKNKSVFINPKDVDLTEEKFDKNNITGYDLFSNEEENLGKVSAVIKIKNNNLIQIYINETEVLLPFSEKTILVLDHSKKQIKLDIPDGLIELYTGE